MSKKKTWKNELIDRLKKGRRNPVHDELDSFNREIYDRLTGTVGKRAGEMLMHQLPNYFSDKTVDEDERAERVLTNEEWAKLGILKIPIHGEPVGIRVERGVTDEKNVSVEQMSELASEKLYSFKKEGLKNYRWNIEVLTRLGLVVDTDQEIVPLKPLLFLAALACPPADRDQVIGDMEERYPKDVAKWGSAKAKLLIARDILVTVVPMIKSITRGGLVWALKLLGFGELVRRFM